jgi:hypothetical protein
MYVALNYVNTYVCSITLRKYLPIYVALNFMCTYVVWNYVHIALPNPVLPSYQGLQWQILFLFLSAFSESNKTFLCLFAASVSWRYLFWIFLSWNGNRNKGFDRNSCDCNDFHSSHCLLVCMQVLIYILGPKQFEAIVRLSLSVPTCFRNTRTCVQMHKKK